MKRAAAALAAMLAFSGASAPAVAACLASPVRDSNPEYGIRTGVAEPAISDLWVSGTLAYSMTRTYPYVERYDAATGWSTTVLGTLARSAFTAIAATSATQAVAVGFEDGGTTALAVSFDGNGWAQTLGAPSQAPVRGTLQKIAAVPGTSTAYAVLAYGASNLLFWNGATWSPVTDALPVGGVLAVSASSARDVWAVGGWTNRYGELRGLVERFDGRNWSKLPAPAPLTMLTSIVARGGADAWVTGLKQEGSGFGPFAAHWNGSSWRQITLPLGNIPSAVYGDVYPAPGGDLWISASVPRAYGGIQTSLWHWNRNAWRYVDGSEGWTDTPIMAGTSDTVWFAAGEYRRTKQDGNKFVGFAGCGLGDT